MKVAADAWVTPPYTKTNLKFSQSIKMKVKRLKEDLCCPVAGSVQKLII